MKLTRFWIEWRGFFAIIVVMILFRSIAADWNQVPSGSMLPSILEGDRLVVDKLAYGLRVPFTRIHLLQWDDPDRGDIVTFPSPQTEELYVKRVIAIPGDLIELRSNQLIINDIPATYSHLTEIQQNKLDLSEFDQRFFTQLQETHLSSERVVQVRKTLSIHERESANFGPYRVPEGSYFVMGDNRNNSRDSRRPEVGTITRDRIMGRAHAVAFSLRTDQYYLPRAHRWFVDL